MRRCLALGLLAALTCGADLGDNASEWLKRCADIAARGDSVAVTGQDGWLFLRAELRHLSVGKFWGEAAAAVSRATKPKWADPLPAIVAFTAQLDRLGIDLLLVPVPPKAVIYPDKLPGGDPANDNGAPVRLDRWHQEFYKLLADRGVKVLDLAPYLLAARKDDATAGSLYCGGDSHWSPRACALTAALIARETQAKPWFHGVPKQRFATEERKLQIAGDLSRALDAKNPARETLPARSVGITKGDVLEPVAPDRQSPVLLLGDSHCLVFHAGGDMYARGMGLADQLAAELGLAVDQMGVRGSGATSARINLYRRTRRDPDYITGKKLIIWCFAAREFTEAMGWRKVPVSR